MSAHALGRTGVIVTPLGFGGAPLGNLYEPVTENDAEATLQRAWAEGVRYFDTAPHYGLGLSETRLGNLLSTRRRSEFVVSTKVGRVLVPNHVPTGSDLSAGGFAVPDELVREWDFSRDGVLRSIDASLGRLKLDHLDVVLVHDPEHHLDQAQAEAIPALVDLREQGVIGAVGAGMNFVAPLTQLVKESDLDVVMIAGRWTLADRSGQPLLDVCSERKVAVLAAAPFNSGLLANGRPTPDARFDYGPTPAPLLKFAQEAADLCRYFGVSLPQAALQFPLRHPAVASVVVGMRTAEQVSAGLGWATTPVPEPVWALLLELPGFIH